MSEYYKPSQESLSEKSKDVREVMQAIDRSEGMMDSALIDSILGIPTFKATNGREYLALKDKVSPDMFSDNKFIYEGTSYHNIRQILHHLKPGAEDIVFDLGSGYGRFCLYGALTTDATFKGVEAVKKRYEVTQKIKSDLDISNVEFIPRNILSTDLSKGDIFYMANPFYPTGTRTQKEVEKILSVVAMKRPITVVTSSMRNSFPIAFKENFQKEDEINAGFAPIEIFRSTGAQISPERRVSSVRNRAL